MQTRSPIQTLNRYLFYSGAIPAFVAMILTIIDVSGRYFRHPLPGTMEISQLCLALIVSVAIAHTQAQKGNIDIDLLFNLMPARVQAVTNIVTTSASLIFTGLMAWAAIPWLLYSRDMKEWTEVLRWAVWPFKAIVFLGVVALSLQLFLDVIGHAKQLRRKTHINAA